MAPDGQPRVEGEMDRYAPGFVPESPGCGSHAHDEANSGLAPPEAADVPLHSSVEVAVDVVGDRVSHLFVTASSGVPGIDE